MNNPSYNPSLKLQPVVFENPLESIILEEDPTDSYEPTNEGIYFTTLYF